MTVPVGDTAPAADAQGEPVTGEPGAAPSAETAPKPSETVDFWKQKSREWERRAKTSEPAASKLAAIEEAKKSAEEKAADATEKLLFRNAELERELNTTKIAAEFQLTGAFAKSLIGNDEAELRAHATELKAEIDRLTGVQPNPGQRAGVPGKVMDMNSLIRRQAGGQ